MNWLTRTALGFQKGLLDLADDLGSDEVHRICTAYADEHPDFAVPVSIGDRKPVEFCRNLAVDRNGGILEFRRAELALGVAAYAGRFLGDADEIGLHLFVVVEILEDVERIFARGQFHDDRHHAVNGLAVITDNGSANTFGAQELREHFDGVGWLNSDNGGTLGRQNVPYIHGSTPLG